MARLAFPGDGSSAGANGPSAPSIRAFTFPTSVPEGAAPVAAVPTLAEEPRDAAAAVRAFLQSEQDRQPAKAWPLLDRAARTRFPTAEAWSRARSARPSPVSFEIAGSQAGPDGAVDVTARVTSVPSLDPFGGLVTARSEVVWRAHREDGNWRLTAEPESTRLQLPGDDAAPATVKGWLSAQTACDASAARRFQAVDVLYGPADLVAAPCRQRGEWTVGATASLSTSPDTSALQSAFGADVASWARVVPVRGPAGATFLAALAPLGEDWRVMGVTAAP